ncbi:hypothetical protein MKCMC460_20530 [Mycobacterium sp. 20KCMC460]|nr:hypothetical protein MKCMC460_20530 [Mycobacterium sp. 20KCMC460]
MVLNQAVTPVLNQTVIAMRGDPVFIGRSAVAGDYDTAARLVAFAEAETGTTVPL